MTPAVVYQQLSRSRFARYAVVGVATTGVHFATLAVAVELLRIDPVPASAIAFTCAVAFSYVGNRNWAFSSTRRHREALPRFVVVALTGLMWNVVLMFVGTRMLDLWYMIPQVALLVIVPISNYVLNRFWTFAR